MLSREEKEKKNQCVNTKNCMAGQAVIGLAMLYSKDKETSDSNNTWKTFMKYEKITLFLVSCYFLPKV